MLKKSKLIDQPYRKYLPRMSLPRISIVTPPETKTKTFDPLKKKDSFEAVDIDTLIETRVKKLKNNAFLYLMHAVPHTSEHFTPYNLM